MWVADSKLLAMWCAVTATVHFSAAVAFFQSASVNFSRRVVASSTFASNCFANASAGEPNSSQSVLRTLRAKTGGIDSGHRPAARTMLPGRLQSRASQKAHFRGTVAVTVEDPITLASPAPRKLSVLRLAVHSASCTTSSASDTLPVMRMARR